MYFDVDILIMYILIDLRWYHVTVLYFFFFKQKTAYEMRISDWSSDVCSSDLLAGGRHRPGQSTNRLCARRRWPAKTNPGQGWRQQRQPDGSVRQGPEARHEADHGTACEQGRLTHGW